MDGLRDIQSVVTGTSNDKAAFISPSHLGSRTTDRVSISVASAGVYKIVIAVRI